MFIANDLGSELVNLDLVFALGITQTPEIGRASCRERV